MLTYSLISIVMIIIAAWGVLSGKLYRRPLLLAALGLGFSLYGAWLGHTLMEISNNDIMSKIFPSLSLSATLTNYTIAAIGGSLIASGVVLEVQRLHEKEKSAAMRQLKIWLTELEISEDMDKNLKSIASSLDNAEFKKKLNIVKDKKSRTIIELIRIQHRYRHLLPDD